MLPAENQNTEWKESWNDDYLRWVCGFANAHGGCICIGKNDRGETVGLSAKECRKLCEDIPNKAQLEPEWTEAKFWGKHGSNPLNPSLAGAFFRAGYVESWGRGIEKMSAECSRVGVAAPTYDLTGRDVMICFERQETAQPAPAPVLQAHELTERQRNILKYLRVRPQASYEDLADYCRVSRRTISTEISRMSAINYLERAGADKKGSWIVKWQGNE